MIDRIRERKEQHKQRGKLYRVSFGIAGAVLIVIGALLTLPGVPGPGLVVMLIGLGMLALEFDRAERLLERLLVRAERAGEQARKASPWQKAAAGLVLAAGLVAVVAAFVLWDVPVLPG